MKNLKPGQIISEEEWILQKLKKTFHLKRVVWIWNVRTKQYTTVSIIGTPFHSRHGRNDRILIKVCPATQRLIDPRPNQEEYVDINKLFLSYEEILLKALAKPGKTNKKK